MLVRKAAAGLLPASIRGYSRVAPPRPTEAQVIRVTNNNVAYLGSPKGGPRPRQLLQLPPFPASFTSSRSLPGRKSPAVPSSGKTSRVTAVTWLKYYFADVPPSVIQDHFNKGLVKVECFRDGVEFVAKQQWMSYMRAVRHYEPMVPGLRLYVSVSIAESKVSKRYDTIPSATLHPNADEIDYLRRLVVYKDPAIIVLNKPPKLPVKGNLPVHNSMDALAAAALSHGSGEGPKLVHKLDRESSGLLLMARSKDSFAHLHWLFGNINLAKTSSKVPSAIAFWWQSMDGNPFTCCHVVEDHAVAAWTAIHIETKAWNEACEATSQQYWALVIGSPKEREGVISAPLSKVFLNEGKTEMVVLAHQSGIDGSQKAVTEYRVMGPTINGCSWVELRPLTGCKHQLRVHCAEALGTPIVGDYKYGWHVHRRWAQMPHVDYEPFSGEPYRLRRPERLPVQKGSVLSKVPLLHLHCREIVLPNVAKFFSSSGEPELGNKPDLLHLVAPMPSHMKISWNLMSSYLI